LASKFLSPICRFVASNVTALPQFGSTDSYIHCGGQVAFQTPFWYSWRYRWPRISLAGQSGASPRSRSLVLGSSCPDTSWGWNAYFSIREGVFETPWLSRDRYAFAWLWRAFGVTQGSMLLLRQFREPPYALNRQYDDSLEWQVQLNIRVTECLSATTANLPTGPVSMSDRYRGCDPLHEEIWFASCQF